MKFRGLAVVLTLTLATSAFADKVITKDGKTYTGKIMIDTDKAVLIGNPPFDPNSYLIQAEDIKTIVYEEYRPNPPSERRRGLAFDYQLQGNAYSSSELSLHPAAGMLLGGGFRFHPLIELGGAVQWVPGVSASGSGLSITATDGTTTATRGYQHFWMYTFDMIAKVYPFYRKTAWKTEPYVLGGYGWSHLVPKSSGDSLSGSGWLTGVGAIRPITPNVFLDARFTFQNLSYDRVHFSGQDGDISPKIVEHQYSFSVGASYRI